MPVPFSFEEKEEITTLRTGGDFFLQIFIILDFVSLQLGKLSLDDDVHQSSLDDDDLDDGLACHILLDGLIGHGHLLDHII